MAASILRHRTARDRLRAEEGAELRRLVAERHGLPERARDRERGEVDVRHA
jgi:hypothetical protein